ncbi:GNAT family protein [Lutibacter sp.]|uniref:GNAT family N-acetyltransferase n=1 Tax=Lutibacter sp. TaxID=1925666 RepID=UPI0025BEAD01|nr:GNAT family protein [Lutibacter sp.]MCF6182132.1 GNAT family N-acetyltransferase [Lutibacter sp.]
MSIIIEKFDLKTDTQRLISWVDSPKLNIIWASKMFTFPLNELQIKEHLQKATNLGTLVFKVIHITNKSSQVIGHAELEVIDKKVKISRLLIAKEHRGKGFGEQMMIALLKFIQKKYPNFKVYLTVFTFNKPAITLYKKLGFIEEKMDTNFMQYQGEIWDRLQMVLKEN